MKYKIIVSHYTPSWDANDVNTDFGDVEIVSKSVIYMADSENACVAFLESIEDGARYNSAVYVERSDKQLTIELGDPAFFDHFTYEIKEGES